MNRRELLSRISMFLVAVPVVGACAAEDDRDTRPPGGGGGGGGDGGGGEQTFMVQNQDSSGHAHTFEISCADLEDGVSAFVAGGAHTHMVQLSDQDVADILDGRSVTVQTSGGHPHTWIVQMPSGLCG